MYIYLYSSFYNYVELPNVRCRTKRCIMPECDPSGALSMCVFRNSTNLCPDNHIEIPEGIEHCSFMNGICCRSKCTDGESFCYIGHLPCPKSYFRSNGTCKVDNYKCCSKVL